MTTPKWRDVYKVHPAADVFPMMSPTELENLGNDISKNGLLVKIHIWQDGNVDYILDGRNRLDAMEAISYPDMWVDGKLNPNLTNIWSILEPALKSGKIAEKINGLNIARRHLDVKQKVDLALAAIKADQEFIKGRRIDRIQSNRSFSPTPGRKGGSTPSIVGQVAKAVGISRKTARKHLAEKGEVPAPVSMFATRPRPVSKEVPSEKVITVIPEAVSVNDPRDDVRRALVQLREFGEFIRAVDPQNIMRVALPEERERLLKDAETILEPIKKLLYWASVRNMHPVESLRPVESLPRPPIPVPAGTEGYRNPDKIYSPSGISSYLTQHRYNVLLGLMERVKQEQKDLEAKLVARNDENFKDTLRELRSIQIELRQYTQAAKRGELDWMPIPAVPPAKV